MKHYNTYLFDFDYTLADSSRGIIQCFQNVLKQHGFTEISDYAIKRTIGKTLEESFSILTGITDAAVLEGLRKEYVKQADVYMTALTRLFPETLEVLTTLKQQGAKIGIISTKYRYRILELLDKVLPEQTLARRLVAGHGKTECKSRRSALHRRQHNRCSHCTSRKYRFYGCTAWRNYIRRAECLSPYRHLSGPLYPYQGK